MQNNRPLTVPSNSARKFLFGLSQQTFPIGRALILRARVKHDASAETKSISSADSREPIRCARDKGRNNLAADPQPGRRAWKKYSGV